MPALLLVLKGVPGAGKTTVARQLSERLRWPLIDKDDISDALGDDTNALGGMAHEVMFAIARRQLLQGLSVICDSSLAYRKGYENAQRIAVEAGGLLAIVECVCTDEREWARRVEGRVGLSTPAADRLRGAKPANWSAQRGCRHRFHDC